MCPQLVFCVDDDDDDDGLDQQATDVSVLYRVLYHFSGKQVTPAYICHYQSICWSHPLFMNVKQGKGLRPGVPVNENCVTSFRDFVTEKKTLSK